MVVEDKKQLKQSRKGFKAKASVWISFDHLLF
jgi:hypothetical protein